MKINKGINHRYYLLVLKNNYALIAILSIVLALMISGLLGVSISHYACAHSLPVTETPAANSIVPKGTPLPSKLTIDFSERPSPTVSSIQVLNSNNEPVNNGDFKIIGDGGREAMTTLDTKKLTDGVYTVSWETQSLDDGHIAKGSFVFGIGNVGPGAAASGSSSVKNNTYATQTKIMNVNTKIEINPFYSGFNIFKVTFTDEAGKPYTKVSTAELTFTNTVADISNEVANLQKIGPGVFSVTGAYISQPGEWDIALAAQRVQDVDLNYEFTAKVTNAPISQAAGGSSGDVNMKGGQMSGMNTSNMTAVAPSTNAPSVQPMNITKIPIIQKNQTGNQTTTAQNYNSTDTMISLFKSGNKLLMQAINNIKTGNTQVALTGLSNAKVLIEQQQLAALDVMSNPVVQSAREHLLAAKQFIETGNTDKAVSERIHSQTAKITSSTRYDDDETTHD